MPRMVRRDRTCTVVGFSLFQSRYFTYVRTHQLITDFHAVSLRRRYPSYARLCPSIVAREAAMHSSLNCRGEVPCEDGITRYMRPQATSTQSVTTPRKCPSNGSMQQSERTEANCRRNHNARSARTGTRCVSIS
jgi:hypothetical protein